MQQSQLWLSQPLQHPWIQRVINNARSHGVLAKWLLADIARLVTRVEIGDPDAIGYGSGGGAKVPDDLDAEYLDERK